MGDVKNFKKGAETAKEALKGPVGLLKVLRKVFDDKDSKIKNPRAVLMLITALTFDVLALLGLIPFVGWILGPAIYVLSLFIFWLWFKLASSNFFSGRATASKIGTAILEAIPEVSAVIPGIFINVLVAIAFVRFEEAGEDSGASKVESPEAKLRNKSRQQAPNGETKGANVLNNKRTPEERRARFNQTRPPERVPSSTAKPSTMAPDVLNLREQQDNQMAA